MRFSASTIILALTLGAVTASPVPAGLETRGRDDVCRANPGLADAIRDVEPVFKASFVEGGHGQKRDVEVEAPQDEEDDLDKRDMNTCVSSAVRAFGSILLISFMSNSLQLNCFLNKLNPLLATRLVVRNQYGAAAYRYISLHIKLPLEA
jgi:hypothetical protein